MSRSPSGCGLHHLQPAPPQRRVGEPRRGDAGVRRARDRGSSRRPRHSSPVWSRTRPGSASTAVAPADERVAALLGQVPPQRREHRAAARRPRRACRAARRAPRRAPRGSPPGTSAGSSRRNPRASRRPLGAHDRLQHRELARVLGDRERPVGPEPDARRPRAAISSHSSRAASASSSSGPRRAPAHPDQAEVAHRRLARLRGRLRAG